MINYERHKTEVFKVDILNSVLIHYNHYYKIVILISINNHA